MKKICVIFVIFSCASLASAFSSGAPIAACSTQSPNHFRNSPQTSSPPIRIVLSQNRIRPGQTINIRVEGINANFLFLGFFIQPRNVVAPNNIVGTMDPNGPDSQIIDCSGPTTATHVDSDPKSSVSVNWTAPQMNGGVRIK